MRSISERTISIFLAKEEHPEHGGEVAGGADVGMAAEGRGVWFGSAVVA